MTYKLPMNEDGSVNLVHAAKDAALSGHPTEVIQAVADHYMALGAKHRRCQCACKFDESGDAVVNWCLVHAKAREDAVREEREACAKIAEEEFYVDKSARPASIPVQTTAWAIRDAIRARSASVQGTEEQGNG